jgi:FdhD protein
VLPTRRIVPSLAIRRNAAIPSLRDAAEETPVAIAYDGSTYAVLMATPADLEDLGMGFSFTEGIIAGARDLRGLDIVPQEDGIEVRIWLSSESGRRHHDRRRAIVGPTGCGLCGVESLKAAAAPPSRVSRAWRWTTGEVMEAVSALDGLQPLGGATRAAHAAGLWRDGRMIAVREDVGRHNALDKIAGATMEQVRDDASLMERSIVVLTSRVSVEMVQKAAKMGAGCIAAISAPTALAVRTAEQAGIALAAVVRNDGFEVFAHGDRIEGSASAVNARAARCNA